MAVSFVAHKYLERQLCYTVMFSLQTKRAVYLFNESPFQLRHIGYTFI